MLKLKVANDNGNSEQDMVINGVMVRQPNVLARVSNLPNLDEVNPNEVLEHIHENLIASVNGNLYYIGTYALKSGQRCHSIRVGVDNDKVSSNIVFVNTLAHIAGEAVRLASENDADALSDSISVSVDMATAIPASYYSASKANTFEQQFMKRNHVVIVYIGNFQATVNIKFECVKAIPEGVTAAHAFLKRPSEIFRAYNKAHQSAPITEEFLKTARIMHIAIGEGTTEFPITKGILFNPDFVDGTTNGNGNAIDRVLNDFKRRFGLMSYTRQDFSNILRNPSHKYYQDAMELIAPALADEADDILQMAEQVIQKANNEVDMVVVYGGGSILMKDSLEKPLQAFCDRARIRLVYIEDEKDAVQMEAYGLDAFVTSKLFDAIKKSQGSRKAN